jgi:hypothetical protein
VVDRTVKLVEFLLHEIMAGPPISMQARRQGRTVEAWTFKVTSSSTRCVHDVTHVRDHGLFHAPPLWQVITLRIFLVQRSRKHWPRAETQRCSTRASLTLPEPVFGLKG